MSRYDVYKPDDCQVGLVPAGTQLGQGHRVPAGNHGLVIGDPQGCATVIDGRLDELRAFARRIEKLVDDAEASAADTGLAGMVVCGAASHEDRPAVAVLIYIGQVEYDEPWCRRHADAFGPDERVSGPDIVPVGSQRHRALEQSTRTGQQPGTGEVDMTITALAQHLREHGLPQAEHLDPALHEVATRVVLDIAEDMQAGMVPITINRWGDLHGYVEANLYGDSEHLDQSDWERVTAAVDSWLQTNPCTTNWVNLDYITDSTDARYYARRDCPTCHGEGLVQVPPQPGQGDTDTCACVRNAAGVPMATAEEPVMFWLPGRPADAIAPTKAALEKDAPWPVIGPVETIEAERAEAQAAPTNGADTALPRVGAALDATTFALSIDVDVDPSPEQS